MVSNANRHITLMAETSSCSFPDTLSDEDYPVPIPVPAKRKFTVTKTFGAVRQAKYREDINMQDQLAVITALRAEKISHSNWNDYFGTCRNAYTHIKFLCMLLCEVHRASVAKVRARLTSSCRLPRVVAERLSLRSQRMKAKLQRIATIVIGLLEESEDNYGVVLSMIGTQGLFDEKDWW